MILIKKVQENIFRRELFGRGAKILVGVSGGPDSVCLLDVSNGLKKKYDLTIEIVHVNYGLRGEDSELDEKLVRNLARKFSLPIHVLRQKADKSKKNSEEKLRNVRYDYFEDIRRKNKFDFIAVGHNLNDQAETVLMRILRGTGLRGLGAIKFKNERIIRPLLNIPRKEILKYLKKKKLNYRIDKTNLGTNFFRNKIRNKLIPYLEKNFNPNTQETMYKISQSVAEDYDFIKRYAAEWLGNKKQLSVSKLAELHPSIQREVVRLAVERQIPDLKEVEMGHIEEILKIVKSKKNKKQEMNFKNLKIVRRGDKLTIGK